MADRDQEDAGSLLSVKSVHPTADTITKLVRRLRVMTLKLLPVEVEPEELKKPSSYIITPEVIAAYRAAAGDYTEALPYALLRARQLFMLEANYNAADFDENLGRATACEVLARRIVHLSPEDRLTSIMSTRYRHRQRDGDESSLSSALELAIDQHCTIFLSSTEAQHVVNCLWSGQWIQINNDRNDIDYIPYHRKHKKSFRGHFNPARLGVPRYQNFIRIFIWILYLFVYSQAVRQPVERSSPHQAVALDVWEIILYTMALSFSLEEFYKVFTTLRWFTWRAFGFWTIISLITDSLLMTAFVFRVIGIFSPFSRHDYHFTSFQVLSFVSPFIWMKLVTVADGYKYVGTMQICVGRMLQESTIFFALLSILAIGFAQGLYALDAADGATDHTMGVVNALIQALLQSPDFSGQDTGAFPALGLYYLWNVATTVILLNILISLFSSAYEDVIDDAEAQYLAFFAGKTVGMIRAPDSYVYPAPFSLIEIFLIAPFELFLSSKAYAKLNEYVMTVLFFIPLSVIAIWESTISNGHVNNKYLSTIINPVEEIDEMDSAEVRDPKVDDNDQEDGDRGYQISKVPFSELTSVFPDASMSPVAGVLQEVKNLKEQVAALEKKISRK